MPQPRCPRFSSPIDALKRALMLGAGLILALALVPSATPRAQAQAGPAPQAGPEYGPMFGPRGRGPGMGPQRGGPLGEWGGYQMVFDEIVVPGQTQLCREAQGAEANFRSYYGPTLGEFIYPFVGYVLPPYGGVWGFYTGAGNVCLWRPT